MKTDDLKGLAVISRDEGVKLGQVDAALFDPQTLQVRAFQVGGGTQTFLLPFDAVEAFGTDALMVQSSAAAQASAKVGVFSDLVELDTLKQRKVVDAAGTFIGTVIGIDSDPTTGEVRSLVIHKGGLLGLGGDTTTIDAGAIRGVGPEVITISEIVVPAAS